jgi:hypothetical protein
LAIVRSSLSWKDMNGISATTIARETARFTMETWYTIWSSVTPRVLSRPWTTMPSESPTNIKSTPASSTVAAVG